MSDNGNNNPWGDKYDPEADRCCKDCGKTFKTKEGILHGKYDFHCSTCHIWWKKTWNKIYIGFGIFLVILIIFGLVWVVKYLKSEDKPKRKSRRRSYDDDD